MKPILIPTAISPCFQQARPVQSAQNKNTCHFVKGKTINKFFHFLYPIMLFTKKKKYCRAFSWTTFQDESNCSSISPGPSSASVIQRSTYSSFLPNSPHINRLSVIKQESVDQSDVFMDYLIPNMKIKEESTFTNYPPPQNPAFLTPATPSPISPSNFPPSSTFFPSNFQQKVSPFPWQSSSSLLSPAPSLLGSSQEELAMCKPWKYDVRFTSHLSS